MTEPTYRTWEQQRDAKRLAAAARIEELIEIQKQLVLDLRGTPDKAGRDDADLTAYGRVYWLRKQVGYVVASLGVGAPDSWVTRLAEREYGEERS